VRKQLVVIKHILSADHRYGSRQMYLNWEERRRANGWSPLQGNEVALLVSITGDQLLFILPSFRNSEGHLTINVRPVQFESRVRWNPLRFKEYMDAANLALDPQALKRFEEYCVRMLQAKTLARARRITSQIQATVYSESSDSAVLR
jgi:hypothetical protein